MKYVLLDTCILINCTLMNATDADPELLKALVERMREQGVKLLIPEVVQFEYERKVNEESTKLQQQTKKFRESVTTSVLPSPDVSRIHETLDKIDSDRNKAVKRAQEYFAQVMSDPEITVSIPLDGDTVAEAIGYVLAGKKPSGGPNKKGLLDSDSLIVASLARFALRNRLIDSDTIIICSDNHTDFAHWDEGNKTHVLVDPIEALFSCEVHYYKSPKLLLEQGLSVAVEDDAPLMKALEDYNQRAESFYLASQYFDAERALSEALESSRIFDVQKEISEALESSRIFDVQKEISEALESSRIFDLQKEISEVLETIRILDTQKILKEIIDAATSQGTQETLNEASYSTPQPLDSDLEEKGERDDMVTYDYDVRSFTDVSPEWGDRLWKFLNSPDIVDRMKAASDAGRPAAGAIGQLLLAEFRQLPDRPHQKLLNDEQRKKIYRIKQFTGYLIKQVMARHGYILYIVNGKKQSRSTPDDPFFAGASVYCKK